LNSLNNLRAATDLFFDPEIPKKFLKDLEERVFPGKAGQDFQPLEVLEFLLYAVKEWPESQAEALLSRTLLQTAKSALFDAPEGGFFEFDLQKKLETNARLSRLYLEAYSLCGEPLFREAASKTLTYLRQVLYDPQWGAFCNGQAGDVSYYRLPLQDRLKRSSPPVERVFYTGSNAMAVLALIKAAATLTDELYEQMTVRILQFVKERLLDQNRGVCRCLGEDGTVEAPGFLSDYAWTGLAFLEAYQYFAHEEYKEFADWLLKQMLQNLWDRNSAGFLNVPREDAAVPSSEKPPLGNAVAMDLLWRLSYIQGNSAYRKWMGLSLKSLLPLVQTESRWFAPYAQLMDMYNKGRVEISLVGKRGDHKTKALIVMLHSLYVPRRVLSFVDPSKMDFILSRGFQGPYPRFFVCREGRCIGSATNSLELEQVLSQV